MASLRTTHPQYGLILPLWTEMRDFHKGENAVKDKGATYLPPTGGMILDGMNANEIGFKMYGAYKDRAVFPDYVTEGVEALMGLIHQHDAQIELPAKMEYLREKASISGESLLMLLRKINEEQLITGRVGLLVDLPAVPDPTNPEPFISLYSAESIINWDDSSSEVGENKLRMIVLDESGYEREKDGFAWTFENKHRLLQLKPIQLGNSSVDGEETVVRGVYQQGLYEDEDYVETNLTTPMLRGAALEEIPFIFVNSKDLLATPDFPPLMGLGRSCLTIYRGEADYRQNLHMQGQDTLVTVGGIRNPNAVPGQEDAVRVGAGSRLDCEMGGDAKFIGVSSTGLAEQRNAIENDRKRAEYKAGQLIGNQSLKNESGSAMIARLASQTANLNQIALTSGEGLQRALRTIAIWLGEDPKKVKVTANTEFTNAASNAQELVYLMSARKMGAPLSLESIHASLKERGYTFMEFEKEIKSIRSESVLEGLLFPQESTKPDSQPKVSDNVVP